MKTFLLLRIFIVLNIGLLNPTSISNAPTISGITPLSTSVRVYEKYEVHFNVATVSQYPFFQYDDNPPPGVAPKIGITVEGIFTSPSGKILRQPAFYMTETTQSGSATDPIFTATNKKYWAIRFSPQEQGQYHLSISAQDASGSITVTAGQFIATAPVKDGFIRVSKNDPRYFEFSDGKLFWPIGPAWGNNYSSYQGTGQNLERPWMGGKGAYSTNWARWMSSAEQYGNEGMMTRLTYLEHAPGHDLSYEMIYPQGYRFWLSDWNNTCCAARVANGHHYRVKFTFKTVNLTGPRNASYSYGLVIKNFTPDIMYQSPTEDQFDTALRNGQMMIPAPITGSHDWNTITYDFTANANQSNIYIYLDNVTGGAAYIDELSLVEIDGSGNVISGEIMQDPLADEHTYVDIKPAAFFDWQVSQGEKNGVYFKYVVHDKNDWIQNHLTNNGTFAATGNGYNPPYNTKARWLLRQWYRYLIARWGYSTNIFAWEMVNEADPNDSNHWAAAQDFAKFMHENDSHPHLAITSMWCCSFNDALPFWRNDRNLYPDIDFVDLHEYTANDKTVGNVVYTNDPAEFISQESAKAWSYKVGKPTMLGETGITNASGSDEPLLEQPNPGVWYHDLLWAQLNPGSEFAPNYWWSQHMSEINREDISKPFYLFVKDLDVNQGGYVDATASVTNSTIRVTGQKNLEKNEAYIWIQNKTHTWKNVMNNNTSSQNGTVTISLNPNTTYRVEKWNTYTGAITKSKITSDANGHILLNISSLVDDLAYKFGIDYPFHIYLPNLYGTILASN